MRKLDNLQINNYKSIKDLRLVCNRINVLIGEPNVGKSNILEAIDLSYLSWMIHENEEKLKAGKQTVDIKEYFRVNNLSDLFYNGDISQAISISHPGFSYDTKLKFERGDNALGRENQNNGFFELSSGNSRTLLDNDFRPHEPTQYFSSPFSPYKFKVNVDSHNVGNYMNILMSPFGNNLLEVIKHQPDFREFISELLLDFNLELNIDSANHTLSIQRKIKPGLIYSMKYEALADTLRRIIFYVAAIRYNNAFIITLEEPDAHSFPKFVSRLADEIIQNTKNQFFIATHNPYLLNNLIENTPSGELGVFLCGFDKQRGTISTKLTNSDLSELLNYGVDIFFNINRYLDGGVKHSS